MPSRLLGRLVLGVIVAAAAAVAYATVGGATVQVAPSSSSQPTITGTAQQGETLTATSGSWNGSTPITFAYQWQRCNSSGASCAAISSATSTTYVVQSADVGSTLRAQVTASNSDGVNSATSNQTAVVTAATGPQNTAAPAITGTLAQGQTLTVSTGTWTGTAPITYAYQWQRCNAEGVNCAPISGAAASTYVLTASDTGNRLQVLVTATNGAGSSSKYSNQTGQVGGGTSGPANTAAPAVTGTLAQGQTLTVSTGTWSGSGTITYAYQWQRCNAQGANCTPISGATATTYTLTSADVGNRLQVLVTATNAGGSSGRYSNQTAAIAASSGGSTKVVAASTVNLPARLIVDRIQYPSGGHSRTPFTARFRVVDTSGNAVSGALVYVVGLPYGWIRTLPETATDTTGWATFTLTPTAKMPRSTSLVMFVRARTPQGDPLAGASTRRLIQVKVRP